MTAHPSLFAWVCSRLGITSTNFIFVSDSAQTETMLSATSSIFLMSLTCPGIFQKRLGLSTWFIRLVTLSTFVALLLFSLLIESPLANSRTFQAELKTPLFENDYFLGLLTTISAHAVPNWYFLSKACNQYVLGGVQLKRPY